MERLVPIDLFQCSKSGPRSPCSSPAPACAQLLETRVFASLRNTRLLGVPGYPVRIRVAPCARLGSTNGYHPADTRPVSRRYHQFDADSCRHDSAIWAECNAVCRPLIAGKNGAEPLQRCDIPKYDNVVAVTGNQRLAVGAERYAIYPAHVALQGLTDRLACFYAPYD